jgi:tRNA threonylcarbamoyladenosine biosynthesis protein TsaE
MNFIIENEKELGEYVWAELSEKLKPGFKCALVGDLGAGKTTLVKEIAHKLNINDHITSPTFNLRKEYEIDNDVYLQHIDLYRHQNKLADDSEVSEWLADPRAISFVEWPSKMSGDLSIYDLVINIEVIGQTRRKVDLEWS